MPADSLLRRSRVSVLIVDDATACRKAARALLERCGYSVVDEADCAATALNYVKSLAPDAVLLDIHLPGGVDLTAHIRDVRPQIAVLLTSSDIDDQFYGLAEAHGARGYVPKDQLSQVDFASFWPDGSGT